MAPVRLDLDEPRRKIRVTFDFDMAKVRKLRAVAGSKFFGPDRGGPYWEVPLDIDTCRQLREQLGELEISPALKAWYRKAERGVTKLAALAQAEDAELDRLPFVLPQLYEFIQGRKYQKADVKFKAENSAPIDCNEPGLGKTVTTIGAVFESGLDAGPHFVSAPKTALEVVWEFELSRFGQPYPVLVAPEGRPGRERVLGQALHLYEQGEPFWLVVNPAMITYQRTEEDGEEQLWQQYPALFDIEWNHVIVDEFHKCGLGNTSTLTARAMNDLVAKKKIPISGTPMGGKPIKLFGPLHFTHPEEFTSKWNFANQWLVVESNPYGGRAIHGIRPGREQAFFDMLSRYMLRRTKAECLPELPPKQYFHVWVDLKTHPKQEAQYRQFEKDAAVRIEEEELSATSILAEYTRLKQFSAALSSLEVRRPKKDGKPQPPRVFPATPAMSAKLDQVFRILEERGIDPKDPEGDEQVVIFSQFTEVVDWLTLILQEQGYPAEKLTGDTTLKQRTALTQAFQAPGGPRVLVMNTMAGGVSITLDRASTAIFMDETWNPDDQEQASDRIHRGSRLHQVFVYLLRAKGTIDTYIMDINDEKQDLNDLILDIRRGIAKRHRGR